MSNQGAKDVRNDSTPGTSNGRIHRLCLALPDRIDEVDTDSRRLQRAARVLKEPRCLIIDSHYGTPLDKVGLQVWKGALLLSELAFSRSGCLRNETVLELGCGVGLTAVALAVNGASVFATDCDSEVLELCRRNVRQNAKLFDASHVRVKRLDWNTFGVSTDKRPGAADDFDFTEDEWNQMLRCRFICAADAVYDFKLNEALFRVVTELCKFGKKKIYFSLEKRLIFSASTLGVSSPFYEQFEEWLWDIKEKGWHAEKIDLASLPKIWMPSRSSLLVMCIISKADHLKRWLSICGGDQLRNWVTS